MSFVCFFFFFKSNFKLTEEKFTCAPFIQNYLLLKFNPVFSFIISYTHVYTHTYLQTYIHTQCAFLNHFENMLHTYIMPFTSKYLNVYFLRIGVVSYIITIHFSTSVNLALVLVLKKIKSNIYILSWPVNSMTYFIFSIMWESPSNSVH